jgi:hypothetical protein
MAKQYPVHKIKLYSKLSYQPISTNGLKKGLKCIIQVKKH